MNVGPYHRALWQSGAHLIWLTFLILVESQKPWVLLCEMSTCTLRTKADHWPETTWGIMSGSTALMPCWLNLLLLLMLQWSAKPNSRQNKPAVECGAVPEDYCEFSVKSCYDRWLALSNTLRKKKISSNKWGALTEMRKLGFKGSHVQDLFR